MVQQLNALACEIEENTGNVNEVSSKFAEQIRSPLLEKMQKKHVFRKWMWTEKRRIKSHARIC